MSEYMFGCGPGHLTKRADQIAAEHGADLVNHTEPRGEKRHWFTIPNRGEPFDGQTAREVMDALRAADALTPKR